MDNGVIELGEEAHVSGPVKLNNGLIAVRGAGVGGLVELARGRLEVHGRSVLEGGLRVVNTGRVLRDSTYVVIKSGARVAGTVEVRGIARLIVEPGADTAGAEFTGLEPEIRE